MRYRRIGSSELIAQLEGLHPESYGWARHCCADQVDAADVLQAVYLKILDGKARYDGRASFKTWLFAVIRNTAAEARRQRVRRRLRLVHPAALPEGAVPEPPEEPLDRQYRQALFKKALAGLSDRQREVLHLVMYHDLTIEEAGRVMGVSLGTARTHYERGKKRLRTLLEATGAFDASEHPR